MRAIFYSFGMFLFVSSLAYGGGIADLDEKDGFRDAKFGMKLSEFPDMKIGSTQGTIKIGMRSSDKMSIGDAELLLIGYGFYKDQLMIIMVRSKGSVNNNNLLKTLMATYGEVGKDSNGVYLWSGTKVELTYKEDDEEGTAIFKSLPMLLKKEAEEKAAAEGAKNDL